ncbi:ImmA/IrrE family metallo-endopeptidase [Tunicatimonas pelagia]|uniref:ImmA/IrrE family metallo-endopeptidase n=1 Tax=Tunicatimonas pelagia TaxID=931531 RepID=UPI0026656B52|nr:ImmA/IrrE family metallo-endopeptidase [Tunicatimonas pelagia]WKN41241.1 ImmA/IrrE family metallo-endopeptidase [Tunicatimonas pelagia]
MSERTTIEKGDDFENRSRQIVERMIDESQIPHLREYIRIYGRKEKGYYSKSREKNIYFDLSIEVWPPNSQRASFTYFIECKNYGKSIPVDDIEEFQSKVKQVSGLNVKAIFITNAPLQEGGYNIAKNEGIMFVQGESSENYQIILHKSSLDKIEAKIPILKSSLEESIINKDSIPLEKLVDSVILSAFRRIENSNYVSYNIDKLSRDRITKIAEGEIPKIDPYIMEEGRTLSTNKLKKYLDSQYKIKVTEIASSSKLLGSFNRDKQLISINNSIVGTGRELFILAHEFGHYILHSKLKIGQTTYENFEDAKMNFRTGKYDLQNPKNWIEWQANQFASSLVLPRACILAWLWRCQDERGLGRGKLYVDDQYDNQRTFFEIIERLAYIFNVTKTSIIYKLREMNLLEEISRLKSIGQIIDEYDDELII